ncbi:MAG: hypothetical protein AAGA58_14250 [Verrucomicrobiota bacterium]
MKEQDEASEADSLKKKKQWYFSDLVAILFLVLIFWIATFPAMNATLSTPPENRILRNGVNIHRGLVNFASGYDGFYPEGKNANEALGMIIDDLTSEKPFFVFNSPWHGEKFAKGPDNLWEFSEPRGTALEAGENAWSFFLGLNPESPANLPLLATIYTQKKTFGVKRICLVVYADGRGDTFEFKKDTIRPSELFPEVNMVDPLPPPEGFQ